MGLLQELSKGAHMLSLFVIGMVAGACSVDKQKEVAANNPFDEIEKAYQTQLRQSAAWLDSMQHHEGDLLQADYLQARDAFKQAEAVLAFVDHNSHGKLNGPNLLKVEEEDLTDIKKIKPTGFQVLEELLFDEAIAVGDVRYHAKKSADRLLFLANNADLSKQQNYHFLWLMRNTIVRIGLTGIVGFDSPMLARSLTEAKIEYDQLSKYLAFFEGDFQDAGVYSAWQAELKRSMESLSGEFDDFDRYHFLKDRTQYQLELWNATVVDWGVTFPIEMALANDAPGLFTDSTFNTTYFETLRHLETKLGHVALGKALFQDVALSKDGSMSCATCHIESLAFTDGMKVSMGQTRNSPTLTYAGLQRAFFHDNRAGSLEGQIVAVVNNESEFHSSLQDLAQIVRQNPAYAAAFDTLYDSEITDSEVRHAIASYIRSLAPFDSKFDRNMSGDEETMSSLELEGFNLFMGKASCATCHFAPLFNGTVPTRWAESEMEHLGVPSQPDTIQATIDPDPGRFLLMGTEERRHFFKTPTLRNIALTAPYMHNGVYETLEEVVDFYNRGGGRGIGIDDDRQTLPPEPLGLTDHEQEALVAFMHTLTDARFVQ